MHLQYITNTFKYYNEKLFHNKLPEVVFAISRDNKMSGMFNPDLWEDKSGSLVHELTLNPDYINPYDVEFHQTLIHEMCHLQQYLFGKPGKSGYHNKEFSEIMLDVGLQTSSTGTTTGSKVGRRMYDLVIEGGSFQKAFQKLQETRFEQLEIKPIKKNKEPTKGASGKRSKYTCLCGLNVWGKEGLDVFCSKCNKPYNQTI